LEVVFMWSHLVLHRGPRFPWEGSLVADDVRIFFRMPLVSIATDC